MLATQPSDMLGAATALATECADTPEEVDDGSELGETDERGGIDPVGHWWSQRLLFFRAVLPKLFPSLPRAALQPQFLRNIAKRKVGLRFDDFAVSVAGEYHPAECCPSWLSTASEEPKRPSVGGAAASVLYPSEAALRTAALSLYASLAPVHLRRFLGLGFLRNWLAPLLEGWLLFDRAGYVAEQLAASAGATSGRGVVGPGDVTLLPLFDGRVSPRLFAILASRT